MLRLNIASTLKRGTALEHFPLMSPSIGSHRWCQCLLCVYSAPAWEISHQATTWTWAWWVDSAVTEPGPHLRLICLAVENNDDVIRNLAPCVKYGEGDLAFISAFLSQTLFTADFWLGLCKIPRDSLVGLLKFCYCCKNSSRVFACPPLLVRCKHTSVFLNSRCCRKTTNNLCEATDGCHALWRPVKIKPSAKWNQRAVGR